MIKLTGDHITEYYQRTRAVGHTQAMIDGIGAGSVVVVTNHQQERALQAQQPLGLYITSCDFGEKSRGLCLPLHIDNHAFEVIWAEARKALNKAENKIVRLESELAEAREELK